ATVGELLAFAGLDFAGASVTIPHKEHLVRLAREDQTRVWEIDPIAGLSGAANTMVVREDGSVSVTNTDGAAAVGLLVRVLGNGGGAAKTLQSAQSSRLQWHESAGAVGSLRGKRIALLGAGGTARGIAASVVANGGEVAIFARRIEQAEAIASSFRTAAPGANIEAARLDSFQGDRFQAVVNCTPVGMAGGPDDGGTPLDMRTIADLPGGMAVMDVVYTPRETAFLKSARGRGLKTISGVELFVGQAVEQFRLWTGRVMDESVFHKVLDETLDGGVA
ncbi:MAG TPA: NAD(P)-binding domain-containing protein, partial [Phycisphaerales bacterium]|nr:NAD(P)-binding domain-containing protein [Phycisphaerales bacterium]